MTDGFPNGRRTARQRWGRLVLTAVLASWVGAASAEPPVLRIVAPANQSMPMLRLEGHRPVDGVLKDLGELLAQRLGLSPVFIALPSKRAGPAVASGAADLLCYVKPEWLDVQVLWTQSFLSGTGIIAAGPNAPPVSRLHDLRDEPLGTVLGYRYPVIDQAFNQAIRREDVADAETNLRRLALGRLHFVVTDRAALAYYLKANPTAALREVLEVEHYQLGCALSPGKADLLQPLNKAIDRIQLDGSVAKLLGRYR
ncbi:ABC-type amino acid transport substrate-binding protein [Pelomonas aquatica]|uniref:ABC-type amino acid transport substrate-binding protein n=1 Tax=Pelomonas aquatica TaxID=431058 RepID=A0ABU1Z7N8_9BURK|nr:transporter substrate-binding domain-containing protein [Pelomonas aquatica]MDR7296623.1 ABC-type amino acid transport substrate-binding protein [Pelomonas aquatica]